MEKNKIEIKAVKKQTVEFTGTDGNKYSAYIEKVNRTYTLKIDNVSVLNEYGNYTRVYYNYGMTLKDVKEILRRYA